MMMGYSISGSWKGALIGAGAGITASVATAFAAPVAAAEAVEATTAASTEAESAISTSTELSASDNVTAESVRASESISSSAENFGPMNHGPLSKDISNTFRSGTYTGKILDKPTTFWRTISEDGNPNGHFWTGVKPQGPLQSVIDLALDQNWGNSATKVIEREFPVGTRIYEGIAAAQRGLVGGGSQIYIP